MESRMTKRRALSAGERGRAVMVAFILGASGVWIVDARQAGQVPGGGQASELSADRLRYEPGARSNWHRHERGQLLFTEQGRGQTQKRGQPIRILGVGDYDYTPPNVEHWHGASDNLGYVE